MPSAQVVYTPSAEPQELTLRIHLVAPPEPVYGPIPPFDQSQMREWMERGAAVAGFAPGDSRVEVLAPFEWGPNVGMPGGLGRLASPGSAPLALPGAIEARWRVRALSQEGIELLVHEILRDLPRAPSVRDERCAHVTSVEVHGSLGGAGRDLDIDKLGRPFRSSGKAPPFPVRHEPQGKTAKRSIAIQTATPKDEDVRHVLYWTMHHWGTLVSRWLQTAWPEERNYRFDTEQSKLLAKSERFLVRRMDFDDPVSFEWPFDVQYPLGLLTDMLHAAHVRGTNILGVTALL